MSNHFQNNIEVITVGAIGIFTILSNFYLQKNNITTAAKERIHAKTTEWTQEIRDKSISLASDYGEQARKIAYIGDETSNGTLKGSDLQKAIAGRYDHFRELLTRSWEIRKDISALLNNIEAVPVLSQKISRALKALRYEYKALDKQLSMDFDRIMTIGDSITPNEKQFKIFAKDIAESRDKLYQFSALIEDLEILINNALVANIYGKRSAKPAENRTKQLTLKGIVNPQV